MLLQPSFTKKDHPNNWTVFNIELLLNYLKKNYLEVTLAAILRF